MKCPQCGNEARPGENFCGRCGAPLREGRPALPQSDAEPVAVANSSAVQPPPIRPAVVIPAALGAQRIAMGTPVPSREQVMWAGRSAFWYWVPGVLWSAAWAAFWYYCYLHTLDILGEILRRFPQGNDFLKDVPIAKQQYGYLFTLFTVLSAWQMVRKSLLYLNNYYEFTTQRVKMREGIFSRRFNQIELFRLKDFSVYQSFWGMLFGYGHLRLISSDRLVADVIIKGVPGGAAMADMMRNAAQIARAESGMVTIKE